MSTNDKKWRYTELPTDNYERVWSFQKTLVHKRKAGFIDSDIILLSEHHPVFTLGRRGGMENLMVSEDFLKKANIPVIRTERGGNITYHGPGQLMIYPIIDLHKAGLSIPDYVACLEDIMIRICGDWGLSAERNSGNPGIWIKERKLGSIGIAVRRGVSFHGLALNINVSLEPFSWINACGLVRIRTASMAQLLGMDIPMKDIRQAALSYIEQIFNVKLERTDPDRIINGNIPRISLRQDFTGQVFTDFPLEEKDLHTI